jgi:hypothetical protein
MIKHTMTDMMIRQRLSSWELNILVLLFLRRRCEELLGPWVWAIAIIIPFPDEVNPK